MNLGYLQWTRSKCTYCEIWRAIWINSANDNVRVQHPTGHRQAKPDESFSFRFEIKRNFSLGHIVLPSHDHSIIVIGVENLCLPQYATFAVRCITKLYKITA